MLNTSAAPLLAPWRYIRDDQLTYQQRRRCLNGLTSPWTVSSEGPAAGSRMHVAFFDGTRDAPNLDAMRRAAAAFDPQQVKLYAIVRVPNSSYLPNFHFVKLGGLLDHKLHGPDNHWTHDKKATFKKVQCIYNALLRVISSAPGKQYVAKVLLPWVFPLHVRRLLVLDSDIIIVRNLRPLWDAFGRFGRAVVGLVDEQSDYFSSRNGYEGFNGGVQLLNLEAMRMSVEYSELLDRIGHGMYGSKVGYHGDQSVYTHMRGLAPHLFHTLGCEWNRQIGSWLLGTPDIFAGFADQTVHMCEQRCGIMHFNHRQLKCVVPLMQRAALSCATWADFRRRQILDVNATCPRGYMSPPYRWRFSRVMATYFYDCCRQETRPSFFQGGYLMS